MINLTAKKSLGQNFLVDPKIHERIVERIDPKEGDVFVEIGPGTGLLTQALLATPLSKLIAFELDERAVPQLRIEFRNEGERFEVIQQDILKVDLIDIARKQFLKDSPPPSGEDTGEGSEVSNEEVSYKLSHHGGPLPSPPPKGEGKIDNELKLRIAGNIPYYITAPILFKLIDERAVLKDATLLVQLEVAERLTAEPRTKAYGIPTVLANFFGEVEFLFKAKRGAFRPVPNVDSAVIQINFERGYFARNAITPPSNFSESKFQSFVRGLFAMRRKTIRNNLKGMMSAGGLLSSEKVIILEESDASVLKQRAEELVIPEFLALFESVSAVESF